MSPCPFELCCALAHVLARNMAKTHLRQTLTQSYHTAPWSEALCMRLSHGPLPTTACASVASRSPLDSYSYVPYRSAVLERHLSVTGFAYGVHATRLRPLMTFFSRSTPAYQGQGLVNVIWVKAGGLRARGQGW
jgi:hypothetical protein